VYSIDPPLAGNVDNGFTNAVTDLRPSDSDLNVAGIRSPTDVRWGDLAFQAVAVRSGGLALYSGHDLASSLRQCIADAAPFYEIAFDPVLTDEPNLYHQIKIQITKPGLTARNRQGYYSQPWPGARFAAETKKLDESNAWSSHDHPAEDDQDAPDAASHTSSPPAPTYVDLPLDQLIKRIPDLKGIQPAQDQKQLPEILEKMGQSVDNFVHNVGDLIANEDVTQQRLNRDGKIKAKERVQDDYLILHHGYEWGANAEYRMDKNGKRLGSICLDKGFLVTSGHALASIGFSTGTQTQSDYRYLGDQKIGARDAFVLAFAQKPGEVTFTTVMRGTGGNEVDMLTQGLLWIDKNNFHILRLRSDLLTPNDEIHLSQLTTDVTFTEVHLQNNPSPLWLPNEVNVFIEIANERYRNIHHYTNYRRYQVAVKIGGNPVAEPETKAPQDEAPSQDKSVISSDAEVPPAMQVNWAPPDVDAEKIDLEPTASCKLQEVMRSASERVEELVRNLDRYTATENIEHFEVNSKGVRTSRETRKFNYLVEIHPVGTNDLDVEEHRNGWMPTEKIRGYPERTEFPDNVITVGLPMLALIFHPRLQSRYEFACEGLSSWKGRRAWVIHFRQRPDQNDSMLTYHVGNQSVAVALRGRAWIDAETSQIVAMESDMLHPIREVQLFRDHQLIEYGPVRFRNKPLELWLPKDADWYCSLKGHRYYRRHEFSAFLLFSVDDKEEIGGPVKAAKH